MRVSPLEYEAGGSYFGVCFFSDGFKGPPRSSLRRAVVAACLSNDEGQLGAVSQASAVGFPK